MKRFRPAPLVGALLGLIAAGCHDIPLVPKWDADWYVPLPSKSIRVGDFFPGAVVLPNQSANVSFPSQCLALDASIGQILSQDLRAGILSLSYVSSLALTGSDTLFIASDSSASSLATGSAKLIASLPFALAQTTTARTVSDTLNSTQLANIKTATNICAQMRGSLKNGGSAPVVLTGTDSVGVKLSLTATIGVSTH